MDGSRDCVGHAKKSHLSGICEGQAFVNTDDQCPSPGQQVTWSKFVRSHVVCHLAILPYCHLSGTCSDAVWPRVSQTTF